VASDSEAGRDPGGNGDRPGSFRVADPEKYNQEQRLRAINQARQRVEELIEQTMIRMVSDDHFDEGDRQQVIRAALYSYLTNIEWLIEQAGQEALLTKQSLGNVQLDPPEDLVELGRRDRTGWPRVIGTASLEPRIWPINGIYGYLTAPEMFEQAWSLQIERRHEQPEVVTMSEQTFMPVHVSLNAFRVANWFLKQAGIDVELEEGQHRTIIGDKELKEVDAWRRQNIR